MPHQQDAEYFLKREAEERALAASSADPTARSVHFELAERYADAAWAAEEALADPGLAQALNERKPDPVLPSGLNGHGA